MNNILSMLKSSLKCSVYGFFDTIIRDYNRYKRITYFNKCRSSGAILEIDNNININSDVEFNIFGQAHLIIEKGVTIDRHTLIGGTGDLRIGKNTLIGRSNIIFASEKITIGENCLFAESVSMRDHDHSYSLRGIPFNKQGFVKKPIKIGDNVWIGAKATILKGVTIGDNVIIGANAVVSRDIPKNTIAVGVPAKVIKTLP